MFDFLLTTKRMFDIMYTEHMFAVLEDIMRKSLSYRERTVQLQRRFTLAGLSMIFVICIIIFSQLFMTHSSAAAGVETYKYYTRIAIEEGDTLTSIASEHMEYYPGSLGDYIDEVLYMNNMTGDEIYAGDHIIVPYYSTEIK